MELTLDCHAVFDFPAIVAAVREEQERLAGWTDQDGYLHRPDDATWGVYEIVENPDGAVEYVSYTTASTRGRLSIWSAGKWSYDGYRNSIADAAIWDCVLPRLPEKYSVVWFASREPWRKPIVAGVEIDVHACPVDTATTETTVDLN